MQIEMMSVLAEEAGVHTMMIVLEDIVDIVDVRV
jgi:hypothetical protein